MNSRIVNVDVELSFTGWDRLIQSPPLPDPRTNFTILATPERHRQRLRH